MNTSDSPKTLNTAMLVAAYRNIGGLFVPDILHVIPDLSRKENSVEEEYLFRIGDFCDGIVSVSSDGLRIKQFTSSALNIAYSEYYESRHGNREMMVLLRPLLESILLPPIRRGINT